MLVLESKFSKRESICYDGIACIFTLSNSGRGPTQRGGHLAMTSDATYYKQCACHLQYSSASTPSLSKRWLGIHQFCRDMEPLAYRILFGVWCRPMLCGYQGSTWVIASFKISFEAHLMFAHKT